MAKKILHSVPAWTLGPRAAHPKFGGGVMLSGIEKVEDRLIAIKKAWPDALTSGHTVHEIVTNVSGMEQYNSPNAIEWHNLISGIESGKFPRIAAITAPAFGYATAHLGSILGPNKDTAYLMHLEAITRAKYLKQFGYGEGIVIWWPAFDSMMADFAGGWPRPEFAEGWDILRDFWVHLLKNSDGTVHLEYKPNIPGARDYINTPWLAIKFCDSINLELGRKAMFINLEFAHALIGGYYVEEAMDMILDAELYDGFAHPNSAEKADVSYDYEGFVTSGTPGDDADWPVGVGIDSPEKTWSDQAGAVYSMLNAPLDKDYIIMEHDVDPAGRNPIEVLGLSITNLNKMAEEAIAN
ncbi:MAG: hypothetical protein WCI57_01725 [Candidatus Berkelbacteria bacterium]